MKTLITLSIIAATMVACTKAATPVPSTSAPVTSPTAPAVAGYVGHWQYAYDTCKKLSIAADSLTQLTCTSSYTGAYTVIGGDTVSYAGTKYILHVVGDTLTFVPYPYNVWDSKYYRH